MSVATVNAQHRRAFHYAVAMALALLWMDILFEWLF